MADEERTEQATPRKRQEARRKGQVARSAEVNAACLFLAFILILPLVLRWGGERLLLTMQHGLIAAGAMRPSDAVLWSALAMLTPIMGLALLVALITNLLQVGFTLSAYPLQPDLNRIDPIKGFQRLFSTRALMELFKSLLKFGIIAWVAWRTLQDEMDTLMATARMPLPDALASIGNTLYQVGLRVGLLWLILALLDYLYQRWEFEKSIRMSRYELKEEFRQTEGDPHVRMRQRQRMQQIARARMIQEVRRADVMITNPVTYAVALRYDRVRMRAPRVVAKGRGWLAQRLREEALRWHVPIVPNPPLARSLYAQVEVGQEIPSALYQAVAEVLAYVYRLRRGRR
ncbi:Flagellar biosynthetic protein FlhB [bacterium HR15]|nr:Flagellar biosynthetic protein FlhB [bacterium HR15]